MQKKVISSYRSSYYHLFLAQETYRDSCYRCPYASLSRPGDLTIGDFWGIEKQHPEILSQKGGAFVKEKGISCVLVNSEKGKAAMEMLARRANVTVSKAEAVAAENKQLNQPSVPGKNRDKILSIYRKHGYEAVEKWFFRYQMRRKIKKKLLSLVPKKH